MAKSPTIRTAEVTVWGLRATDGALKDLAPDLRRILYRQMGSAVKTVATQAKSNTIHLSQMRGSKGVSPIGANAQTAVDHIKVRRGASSSKARAGLFGFRVEQTYGYGVIAEFARQSKTPQGAALVEALNRKYGSGGGRFLWSAMDAKRASVEETVLEAVRDAERMLQRRLDSIVAFSE